MKGKKKTSIGVKKEEATCYLIDKIRATENLSKQVMVLI